MNVISMEEKAFFVLLEQAVQKLSAKYGPIKMDKWISGEEAMRILRITSKTTLSNLRNTGK